MSSYTLEKIEKECNSIANKFGEKVTTPILINGRLRTTLGRVKYEVFSGVPVPTSIEFNKKYIENATDEQVLDTIRHEMAHWLTAKKTGEVHHHDNVWKAWCLKTGANPERLYDEEKMGKLSAEACPSSKAKYTLYCTKCGKVVGTRSRACNVTKYPSMYTTRCCKAVLTITTI